MLDKNSSLLLQMLDVDARVLDVGGWARPFNRANVVVDIHPYESRGFFGSQGGSREFFNRESWIVHDVSSRKRLPFDDKSFDFVVCAHTLEDIRDPIFLCSELVRVGKQGYIEVPSQRIELTKGVANSSYCGYYHHRWLVDVKQEAVIFRFKPHFIHNYWKYHFPKSSLKYLPEDERSSYLFWNKCFNFGEVIQISRDETQRYIENFVKREDIYPSFFYSFDSFKNSFFDLFSSLRLKFNPQAYKHRAMDTKEHFSR